MSVRLNSTSIHRSGTTDQSDRRLQLLDGFELRCRDEVVTLPMTAQRLLALLAMQDRPLTRSHVAGTLWLDTTDEHAGASLRSALWRLRRPGHRLVEVSPAHLRLASDVAVDYLEVTARARRLLDGDSPRELILDAAELAGDLLPDWWEDWILLERERFRQLRLHALETLCARLAATGRFAAALEAGLSAVACEPLRESAHRLLIEVHLAEGNRAEALRQYQEYARLLYTELGLHPADEVRALVDPLRLRRNGAKAVTRHSLPGDDVSAITGE
jgi:DNA-binding SARP family transcriptional activator